MAKRKAPASPMTTPQLIDLAKRKLAETEPPERRGQPMTDYRFAKRLGIRQVLVSNWQLGKSRIGRQFVTKFAEVTGLPEAYVFACVELEREKDPGVRGILLAMAGGLAAVAARRAAVVVLSAGMGMLGAAPLPSQAAAGASAPVAVCILCPIDRRSGRAWRRRRRFAGDVIRATAG